MRIEESLTEQMDVANRLREKIILANVATATKTTMTNEGGRHGS
jgi:hypothetical protein